MLGLLTRGFRSSSSVGILTGGLRSQDSRRAFITKICVRLAVVSDIPGTQIAFSPIPYLLIRLDKLPLTWVEFAATPAIDINLFRTPATITTFSRTPKVSIFFDKRCCR